MCSCQRLTVHTDRLGTETNYIMFSKRSIFTLSYKIPYYSTVFFLSLGNLDVLCNKAAMINI